MKNTIFKIALLAILGLTAASCKKFLEKEPVGRVTKVTLFEDVPGAKQALNGSYNLMLTYYQKYFGMYGDVASDNMILKSTKTEAMVQQFNFQSSPGDDAFAVGNLWLSVLSTLNHVNNIINALPDLEAKFPNQAAELAGIRAQALVLRAMCHFDLSRAYAQPYNFTPDASHLGVPVLLKTPSPGEQISRNTMKETYDQILKDINDALPILKIQTFNQYKISYPAALGLLSRIYLYKGDWDNTVINADLVIKNEGFSLATPERYLNTFINYPSAATDKTETIFQLTGAGLKFSSSNISSIYSDTAGAQYMASRKMLDMFDNTDIRKSVMFTSGPNKYFTNKYGETKVTDVNAALIKILRLSEVYLNRAEAKWNQNKYTEAAEDLRIISQRAHPGQTVAINYNTPADLYKYIADERNRELCFENHRLFDIVRRKENLQRGADCNATICSLTYPNDKFALPIPTKEIDANKAMKQNPGYN